MRVFVVVAEGSKTLRRIIRTDGDPAKVVTTHAGERVIETQLAEYDHLRDANALAAWLAEKIGPPLHDCRCVEINAEGLVVGVHQADPVLDKPVFGEAHTLELHATARVGERKVNGSFPARAGESVVVSKGGD